MQICLRKLIGVLNQNTIRYLNCNEYVNKNGSLKLNRRMMSVFPQMLHIMANVDNERHLMSGAFISEYYLLEYTSKSATHFGN